MKTLRLLAAIILMAAWPLLGATADDYWANVSNVTRERTYDFVTRDRHCVMGKIVAVTDELVTVEPQKAGAVTLNRADVLQVTSGSYIVYSGRSSWADFAGYKIFPREGAIITRRDGKKYRSGQVKATDSVVTLEESGRSISIPKSNVTTVVLISDRPLSGGDEYWLQECAVPYICVLNAGLWPRWVGIGRTMHVRLYDSSMPEDNTPLACKANP